MKMLFTVVCVAFATMSGVMCTPAQAGVTACSPLSMQKPEAKKGDKVISPGKQNSSENLQRSRCMIALILDDLATNYGGTGGGGISSIKAVSSTSYIVSLPQEERVDLLTYEFDLKTGGSVSIKRKLVSTQSVAPQSAAADPPRK